MSKSILHDKNAGTCYFCMALNGDFRKRNDLQEHHAIYGTANRKHSERYGLKVYLCLQHHTAGPMAVHNNAELRRRLQKEAQEAFEKRYSHEKWMEVFGRNFI